jgi:hypothetical protein
MFALLAKSALSAGVLLLNVAVAQPQGARIEARTDDRQAAAENSSKKAGKGGKRTVWNLDGGVFFATDGHLPNGSCFRLSGQMNSGEFFDGLRRVDDEEGTTYLLREQVVTRYPQELSVTLHLLDFPCSPDLKDTAVRPPLTRELMGTLRLNFFWKEGVRLRPVEGIRRTSSNARRLAPFATDAAADELAPRFEWNYGFTVPSENVPLSNDLVLIIEDEDHKMAARVAAKL